MEWRGCGGPEPRSALADGGVASRPGMATEVRVGGTAPQSAARRQVGAHTCTRTDTIATPLRPCPRPRRGEEVRERPPESRPPIVLVMCAAWIQIIVWRTRASRQRCHPVPHGDGLIFVVVPWPRSPAVQIKQPCRVRCARCSQPLSYPRLPRLARRIQHRVQERLVAPPEGRAHAHGGGERRGACPSGIAREQPAQGRAHYAHGMIRCVEVECSPDLREHRRFEKVEVPG